MQFAYQHMWILCSSGFCVDVVHFTQCQGSWVRSKNKSSPNVLIQFGEWNLMKRPIHQRSYDILMKVIIIELSQPTMQHEMRNRCSATWPTTSIFLLINNINSHILVRLSFNALKLLRKSWNETHNFFLRSHERNKPQSESIVQNYFCQLDFCVIHQTKSLRCHLSPLNF